MKTLEKEFYMRIIIKYGMLSFLIIFTLIMIIGVFIGEKWAVLGYLGIICIIIMMIVFPTYKINYDDIPINYYRSILEFFSKSYEMKQFIFVEAIYIFTPEINRLLYGDDKSIVYYSANLRIMQSLLKNNSKLVIEHPNTFANICQDLLQELNNKNNNPNLYIVDRFNNKPQELIGGKRYIALNQITKHIPFVILFIYFIFKLTITFYFYDSIENLFLLRVAYNVGADFIAVVILIIQRKNN